MKRCCERGNLICSGTVALVCICAVFLTGGCAEYRPVQSEYTLNGPHITLQAPTGWLEKTAAAGSCRLYVFTRDGVPLENIAVRVTPVGKKLQKTERVYRADMLPQEVAELTMGLLQTEDSLNAFQCDSVDLVQLAGEDAYRATFRYTDQNGLEKRCCLLGTIVDRYVIEIGFDAANEVYYERYLGDFERVVQSVRRP